MKSPEIRTKELFSLPVDILSQRLEFQVVEDQTSGNKIQLTKLQPWARGEVGKTSRADVRRRYHQMREFNPGDWCAYLLNTYRMRQSLIVASDSDGTGACVRIIRASRFDPVSSAFTPMPREGDIANLFKLEDNERAMLSYLNDTNILYLQRTGDIIRATPQSVGASLGSTTDLEKLLDV